MDPADYFVDTKSELGRGSLAYGKTWPTTTLRPTNGVVVTFTAGHALYSGTVTTAGTAVTRVSGTDFNVAWTAGKTIIINGVAYAIASVGSVSGLTLMATAGAQGTAVAYIANDVPRKVILAMLLLIGHWYENRETTTVGAVSREIEFAVKSLLWQDRVVPI